MNKKYEVEVIFKPCLLFIEESSRKFTLGKYEAGLLKLKCKKVEKTTKIIIVILKENYINQ